MAIYLVMYESTGTPSTERVPASDPDSLSNSSTWRQILWVTPSTTEFACQSYNHVSFLYPHIKDILMHIRTYTKNIQGKKTTWNSFYIHKKLHSFSPKPEIIDRCHHINVHAKKLLFLKQPILLSSMRSLLRGVPFSI